METSKKIAWFSGVCFVATLIYSMVIFSYCTIQDKVCDYTMLITLITTASAVFGVAASFYYNKARCENVIKLQGELVKNKYLVLKEIGALDQFRVQSELDNEWSKIESNLDNEFNAANQELSYVDES
jgi:hypothetical protein